MLTSRALTDHATGRQERKKMIKSSKRSQQVNRRKSVSAVAMRLRIFCERTRVTETSNESDTEPVGRRRQRTTEQKRSKSQKRTLGLGNGECGRRQERMYKVKCARVSGKKVANERRLNLCASPRRPWPAGPIEEAANERDDKRMRVHVRSRETKETRRRRGRLRPCERCRSSRSAQVQNVATPEPE